MKQEIQYHDLRIFEPRKIRMIRADREADAALSVISEHRIDVYINEVLTMKLSCTPELLEELVLGRLLTEGIISGIEDVDMIYICEFGARARVYLKERPEAAQKTENNGEADEITETAFVEETPSCCTDNHVLNDAFVRLKEVKPVHSYTWKKEWIFHMMDVFEEDLPLHKETDATHGCYLMLDGEIVFACEDIGRHNALDKVIGHALMKGYDLTHSMIYTTGRTPVDMVMKVIRAGIPVIVTRKSPTLESLELAKQYGLTIVGEARKGKIVLYE